MRLLKPELFQGVNKKRNYFEGWYYKIISQNKDHAIALIPGVSFDKNGKDKHAFIQFFDAVTGETHYFRYSLSEFHSHKSKLDVKIGKNRFCKEGVQLDLKNDKVRIKGKLRFSEIISYPRTLWQPGIMGPFSFVPFMECYHGVVNIHQTISGSLQRNGQTMQFDKGYGYVEKDWGKSFPQAWIWMQSNHFEKEDASFMFSVAAIPFFRFRFTGFLCFLRIGDQFYRFATYSGAKLLRHRLKGECLDIKIRDRKHALQFRAINHQTGKLIAPESGEMVRTIEESITATIHLKLSDKKGNLIFGGAGKNAGLEIVNYENIWGCNL